MDDVRYQVRCVGEEDKPEQGASRNQYPVGPRVPPLQIVSHQRTQNREPGKEQIPDQVAISKRVRMRYAQAEQAKANESRERKRSNQCQLAIVTKTVFGGLGHTSSRTFAQTQEFQLILKTSGSARAEFRIDVELLES